MKDLPLISSIVGLELLEDLAPFVTGNKDRLKRVLNG